MNNEMKHKKINNKTKKKTEEDDISEVFRP